jgi:hypothetical protein
MNKEECEIALKVIEEYCSKVEWGRLRKVESLAAWIKKEKEND